MRGNLQLVCVLRKRVSHPQSSANNRALDQDEKAKLGKALGRVIALLLETDFSKRRLLFGRRWVHHIDRRVVARPGACLDVRSEYSPERPAAPFQ